MLHDKMFVIIILENICFIQQITHSWTFTVSKVKKTPSKTAKIWRYFHRIIHNKYIRVISTAHDVQLWISIIQWCTVGNRTMVAAATIVIMAAAKKALQNVFALYHSYNRTILLGFIWILDFHFKIVLVRQRRYLIPIWCNNGKRKIWPWRWLHHFDFSPDDGSTRWLTVASFPAGNFWHTHTADPLQTNMHIGCMIVVKCDTCKIAGAYAHLDYITSTVGDIGNRHSM